LWGRKIFSDDTPEKVPSMKESPIQRQDLVREPTEGGGTGALLICVGCKKKVRLLGFLGFMTPAPVKDKVDPEGNLGRTKTQCRGQTSTALLVTPGNHTTPNKQNNHLGGGGKEFCDVEKNRKRPGDKS